MKINKQDLKHNTVLITPENLTDLYLISQVIEVNDQVYGQTTRRVRTPGKESREGDKGERVKVYLGIQVLEVDFQDSEVDQRLRIKGRIISGPEDVISLNSSHTINISLNQTFTLRKIQWFDYHFSLLAKSEAANRPLIGVVAIEPGLFTIAKITNFKIHILFQDRDQIPGKQSQAKVRSASETNFFKKILSLMKNYFSDESLKNIVLAGPASYKSKFAIFLQEEWRNSNKVFLVEDLSSALAVNELVNRQTLQKLAGEYQIMEESSLLTDFEIRLNKDFNTICYGLDQCTQAAEQGAIESLLIVDRLFKSDTEHDAVIQLMDQLDKTRVKYYIVDYKSENGKIIQNFGGVLGILRYALFLDN